jgi:uncharacterized membrane protein
MTEALRQFIETYYIHPITHDTGYNPINTITWALVLVVCLFLTFRLLKRLKIDMNYRFIAAVVPYIVVGASLRVMEDAELLSPPLSYLLITPLIFFVVFFCCLALLFLSVTVTRLERLKAYDYTLIFGLLGVLWCFANLAVLLMHERVAFGWVLFAVIAIAGVLVGIIYAIAAHFDIQFLTEKVYVSVLAAHLLDAASSFIGIDMLGYTGKHVIEGLIVEYTGTAAGMFPLKLGILVPIMYVLDTQFREDAEEIEQKNIVLLALLVIGLAPAVRNTLRMVLGV